MAEFDLRDMLFYSSEDILVVAADRSLISTLQRIEEKPSTWVVVVRSQPNGMDHYYYAYLATEITRLARENPGRQGEPLASVLDLHEWRSSPVLDGARLPKSYDASGGPAAARLIKLDADEHVVAVGAAAEHGGFFGLESTLGSKPVVSEHMLNFELLQPTYRGPSSALESAIDDLLGPTRSGSESSIPASATIDLTCSAECATTVALGSTSAVKFQIELTDGSTPLAASTDTIASVEGKIEVSLSLSNSNFEVVQGQDQAFDPPTKKEKRHGSFVVSALREGRSFLSVTFRQLGSRIAVVRLSTEVVGATTAPGTTSGRMAAAPHFPADASKLTLEIERLTSGQDIVYEYRVRADSLGLRKKTRSKALLDRGKGVTQAELDFVSRIYADVTKPLLSAQDLKNLERDGRALGAALSRELLDPDIAKWLWPLRDRIQTIEIISWEPYIPWELVRLQHPDTNEIDDKFLAEYGLVRSWTDDVPPRWLELKKWQYLGAKFPLGSLPNVGAELDYFTQNASPSLKARGFQPVEVPADRDALYDVLAAGEFDVLHISCHAESDHKAIDRARLILADQPAPTGGVQQVAVDTLGVQAEARLRTRRPLIFLNGCETGRVGPVLTDWGGWPNVFRNAGAGAFVGSSWPVRDKPAGAFATAFYEALHDGLVLWEAANKARAAAKLGDLSWLAFRVYGEPLAQRAK